MADDDRQQAEVDADGRVRRLEREPGDDPGQRDRQDDDERDRLAPEEAVARHRERDAASPARARPRVAPSAACTESQSASRTSSSWYATENHFVEKFSIGQLCVTLSLKA